MSKLRNNVFRFMLKMGQFLQSSPGLPPDAVVRLRARLVAEETFELLSALFPQGPWCRLQEEVMGVIGAARVSVDMPALADALGDIDYVVEGTRLAFGIDGGPIADAIHAANMAKVGGPVDEHGKRRKPAGWRQPDIDGELRKQGW